MYITFLKEGARGGPTRSARENQNEPKGTGNWHAMVPWIPGPGRHLSQRRGALVA